MRDGRTRTIQPCLLVCVSWGPKSRGSHLLSIKAKSRTPWIVLTVRNRTGDRFRFKMVPKPRHVLIGIILPCRERWNASIFLCVSPMEDISIFLRVRWMAWHVGEIMSNTTDNLAFCVLTKIYSNDPPLNKSVQITSELYRTAIIQASAIFLRIHNPPKRFGSPQALCRTPSVLPKSSLLANKASGCRPLHWMILFI